MMKLKALKNITVAGRQYIAGEIFEVHPSYDFQALIDQGLAELEDEETED